MAGGRTRIPWSRQGGTPSQVQVGGGGVPHPRSRHGRHPIPGYPPHLAGGTPSQIQVGGYPILDPGRGVPAQGTPLPGMGAPAWGTPPHLAGGTPCLGYPPLLPGRGAPAQGTPPPTWQGVPAQGTPPPQQEQHSVYLLRGGRYASCVHAGGLSCFK